MKKPLLIVIAGPNGAGKTTFVEKASIDFLQKTTFINSDIIAKHLKDKYPNKKDIFINIMAGKESVKLYEKYLNEKFSFSMETTLSGNSPIRIMKKAKENGFEISLIFIGIQSPSNSKLRIENRVVLGGHNVPDEDVVRRYFRSMENLRNAILISDKVKIYDNTFEKHQLILELEGDTIKSIENIVFPEWFQFLIDLNSLKLGGRMSFQKKF